MSDVKDELLEDIVASMTTQDTSLDESFYSNVLDRLVSLGYTLQLTDCWEICFCILKVEKHIITACNIPSIPDDLILIAVDRVCGEFFNGRKLTGRLSIGSLDFTGGITSIKEGDTTVSFDSGDSDDKKFTTLLSQLMHEGEEGDFICYRKLKW